MKNMLRFILLLALSIACILFFLSCSKNNTVTAVPKPVDTGGGTPTCTATKTAAENIQVFPPDNAWNKDISTAPVDPFNTQIIAAIAAPPVKADFGSGLWQGAPIGIPYIVVCGNEPRLAVNFTDYGNESDPGPYPVPLTAPIEGNGSGDAHVIAVDIENKILYEMYNARVNGNHWDASSGAIFNLNSNNLRPDTWTSADAAGLPIFPGLVRYDEIVKGAIDHPIRFTLTSNNVKPAYILPARHKVNSTGGQYSLPFGARIRLKAGFDISGFSATNQIILRAMKKYGLILADIGSNMYISGAPDSRWNNDDLQNLGLVHGSDFEVVKFN